MKHFKDLHHHALYYIFDDVHATDIEDEALMLSFSHSCINLRKPKPDDFLRLLKLGFEHTTGPMVRFVFSYEHSALQARRLPLELDLNVYYAWYGLARLPHSPFPKKSMVSQNKLALIDIKQTRELSEHDKAFLIERWNRDYINTVLANHPKRIQALQLDSFKQGLQPSDQKKHYLFYHHDQLVGHYAIHTFAWPPFGGQALDPHRWIEQGLEKNKRRIIHAHISHILKEHEHLAMGAGVVQNNEKSLKLLEQNGFIPLHLCVKKINPS